MRREEIPFQSLAQVAGPLVRGTLYGHLGATPIFAVAVRWRL